MVGIVKTLERILVPLDHSAGLELVVEYACVVAKAIGGSLTLMHVYEPPNEMVGIVPGGTTVMTEVAAEEKAGEGVLERATAIARAAGIATVDRILERAGPAHHAILAHARAGRFDLIVMGTHGRRGVSRLLLGSVAEQVLRSAPCPVLMVHLPHE